MRPRIVTVYKIIQEEMYVHGDYVNILHARVQDARSMEYPFDPTLEFAATYEQEQLEIKEVRRYNHGHYDNAYVAYSNDLTKQLGNPIEILDQQDESATEAARRAYELKTLIRILTTAPWYKRLLWTITGYHINA